MGSTSVEENLKLGVGVEISPNFPLLLPVLKLSPASTAFLTQALADSEIAFVAILCFVCRCELFAYSANNSSQQK